VARPLSQAPVSSCPKSGLYNKESVFPDTKFSVLVGNSAQASFFTFSDALPMMACQLDVRVVDYCRVKVFFFFSGLLGENVCLNSLGS